MNDEHFSEQRDATNGIARRGVLGVENPSSVVS